MEHVQAVLPFVMAPVRAMIGLQLVTGMRPGEVIVMKAADLTMQGPVWQYKPPVWKLTYRGQHRVIHIGAKGQGIIRPFLTTDLTACLFKPVYRKSPHYSNVSYAKAVERACLKAGIPAWSPNQLRHAFATEVRAKYGLETAGASLGHARLAVTEIYAQKNQQLAERVAREVG
jgi:integrase